MSETQTQSTESKSKRQMSFTALETGEIRADFPDSGLDPFVFHPAKIPEGLYADALADGVVSRLRGFMGRLTGDDRTAENMRAALVKGWETIQGGSWKIERVPGEAGVSYTIEVEAAFVFRQKRAVAKGQPVESAGTIEEAATQYAALTDERKAELKAIPLYQAAYAEVKAKRAAENAAKLAKKAAKAEEKETGTEDEAEEIF